MGKEEEEGKRTIEDRYKELRPYFASISLVTPPLDAYKIIYLRGSLTWRRKDPVSTRQSQSD
jgi:hypothetical protein